MKDTRRDIIDALLEAGHMPIVMEYQPADPDDVQHSVRRRLLHANFVVIILGRSYGSTFDSPEGRTWTISCEFSSISPPSAPTTS